MKRRRILGFAFARNMSQLFDQASSHIVRSLTRTTDPKHPLFDRPSVLPQENRGERRSTRIPGWRCRLRSSPCSYNAASVLAVQVCQGTSVLTSCIRIATLDLPLRSVMIEQIRANPQAGRLRRNSRKGTQAFACVKDRPTWQHAQSRGHT